VEEGWDGEHQGVLVGLKWKKKNFFSLDFRL
jgi:hypothetical protein